MAEFVSQKSFPSTTTRTLERTAFLAPLDEQIQQAALEYFSAEPRGTQVTLMVLRRIGADEVRRQAAASSRTFDETKQCLGLRVPIVLVRLFGDDGVATYRDPKTNKASTRSRSANWPELDWVSRYTPHQVSEVALNRRMTGARR